MTICLVSFLVVRLRVRVFHWTLETPKIVAGKVMVVDVANGGTGTVTWIARFGAVLVLQSCNTPLKFNKLIWSQKIGLLTPKGKETCLPSTNVHQFSGVRGNWFLNIFSQVAQDFSYQYIYIGPFWHFESQQKGIKHRMWCHFQGKTICLSFWLWLFQCDFSCYSYFPWSSPHRSHH